MTKENNKENKTQSDNNQKFYSGVLLGVGIVFLVLIAFFLGLKMGRKEFYYRYPPMFYPFFKEKHRGFVPPKFRGHGLVGTVDSVGKESFVVKNRWGELITVLVDKNTRYYLDGQTGKFSDIKKDKLVTVVGYPKEDEVAIQATVVRILK